MSGALYLGGVITGTRRNDPQLVSSAPSLHNHRKEDTALHNLLSAHALGH